MNGKGPANPYPERARQAAKAAAAEDADDWEEVKKEDISEAELEATRKQMSGEGNGAESEDDDQNEGEDDDEFHMIRTPAIKKKQTKMRLLKNGVAKFL